VIYGLFIQDSPSSGEAFTSASRFAAAALARGHGVRQIFLYGDAVLAALQARPSGIRGLDALIALAERQSIPLLACQAALERLNVDGGRHPAIRIGSLGQWFDALHDVDRVVSFES
jgi:tRNA 2-thiouridine synthesizing protein D